MSAQASGSDEAVLVAVLDVLLPGGDGFPPASAIGLAGWIGDRTRFVDIANWLQDEVPTVPDADLAAALRALEAREPDRFGALIVAAYSGYYTHPDVLAVIEATAGYKAGPPQPGGYGLDAFDPDMLAVPRARPPSYRDPNRELGR